VDESIPPGTQRVIEGRIRVYYDGYWIRAYPAPADTLQAKRHLIEALTRRLFHHVEHGLNVPGTRLREAREAFEKESDPRRKRVKGAMLAGSLFNRAADIFRKVVELQSVGVQIDADNGLLRECGGHLEEALELAKLVLHRSGEEGLDELWGEPFKAFCLPIDGFYRSRYVKIAQTMADIDRVGSALTEMLRGAPAFDGIEPLVVTFVAAAKAKVETLCTDDDIFDVWSAFVVAGEELLQFEPRAAPPPPAPEPAHVSACRSIIRDAKDVVMYVTRARVPMPKTTAKLIARCKAQRTSMLNCTSGLPAPESSLWAASASAH
jgi:hypothetical protein